ncbi:MAG: hypothetical protein EPO37_08555 [Nitrosarchaeum sp.]|nr:MAG: hypothetical protein EPO37_08555 [Nitrosarchaeum sp.]
MVDYITGVAIALTMVLGTLGYFMFKPEIDRKLRKQSLENDNLKYYDSQKYEFTNVFQTRENILDNALNEIRRFVKDWGKRVPWDTGYRRLISRKEICRYSDRISLQAQRLQRTIKPIRELKISNSKTTIDNFSNVLDELIELGAEIETNCSSELKDDSDKLRKMISDGEKIISDFKHVIIELEKLRKKL